MAGGDDGLAALRRSDCALPSVSTHRLTKLQVPRRASCDVQLTVSDEISTASREHGLKAAAPMLGIIDLVRQQGVLKNRSLAFVGAIEAMAITTMDFMIREPKQAAHYREAGSETLWKAIS